ncbi:MAG: hypothetical protein AB8C13_02260 [Phycisphaerales bacterium]
MSTTISNVWHWSVKHSPLLNLGRWILRPRKRKALVRDLLANADLPQELTHLIETTVRKTRLWKSERIEIAKELITHTQDALEAGRSPEQITESFGNPKKVAKLLKRAAKRKRPLHWRTLQRTRQSIGVLIILFFMVYAVQFVRFVSGKPSINTNYVAQINAHNEAYTEDEKAWPIYNQANIAWVEHSTPTRDRQYEEERLYNDQLVDQDQDDNESENQPMSAGFFMIPNIPTDHPHYEETAQLIRDFAPHLDQIRQAAHRPIIGINLSFDLKITEEGDNPHDTRMAPPPKDPKDQPILVDLLLPNLGTTRQHANLLYFDMLVAARDGDNPRVYENLSAILAITRQKSFDGTLITDLVRIAIAGLANEGIKKILTEHPETLTREQLVNLSHELALVRPHLHLSFDGERMMFDDVLQRIYTDDGNGNGRLTQNGVNILNTLADYSSEHIKSDVDALSMLTGPIALSIAPNRKSQHEIYHSMIDLIEYIQLKGPQYIPLLAAEEYKLIFNENRISTLPYSPIEILLPALSNAVNRTYQAHMTHDATATMLALEIYKLDHDTYPASLSQLAPRYLPIVPEDLFNPGDRIRYLSNSSGYSLYSVGSDGDDDQAVPTKKNDRFPHFTDRFPPQYTDKGILIEANGDPVILPPQGPDGDWIFINIDNQSTLDPKTKEPDQSPAPESIN